jgi:hypothetical protein
LTLGAAGIADCRALVNVPPQLCVQITSFEAVNSGSAFVPPLAAWFGAAAIVLTFIVGAIKR